MFLESVFRMFRIHSIKGQLRYRVSFLIILVGLLNFIPMYFIEQNNHQAEAIHNLKEATRLQKTFVEKWLKKRTQEIEILANLPATRALDKAQMKENFLAFVKGQDEFYSIVYINPSGITEIDTDTPPGINVSDRDYFQEALKGKAYVTDALIGRATGKSIIIFSSPVYNNQNQFAGCIFGAVELSTISRMMKSSEIGETGEIYLVNRKGVMLTESRFTPELIQEGRVKKTTQFEITINTPILREALAGQQVQGTYTDYHGHEVIGTYQWTDNHKWLIIGEIDKAEIDSPFRSTIWAMGLILVFVLLIGHLIMLRFSNKLVEPIQFLLDAARTLREGNFQYKIPTDYNGLNELKELCQTFNQMVETIDHNLKLVAESEKNYRLIAQNMTDLVTVLDPQGKVIYASPSHESVFGVNLDEYIGSYPHPYIHPDDLEKVRAHFQAMLQSKAPMQSEFRWRHRDGRWLFADMRGVPIVEDCGAIKQIVLVSREITERKKAEEKTQAIKNQLSLIYNSVSDLIFFLEVREANQYYCISVNQSYLNVTGMKKEEIVGKEIREIFPQKDSFCELDKYREAVLTKNILTYEEKLILPGGELIAEITLHPIPGKTGEITHLLGVARDITERKKTELLLEESEQRYKSLFDNNPDASFALDLTGKFISVNQTAAQITGYEGEELLNGSFNRLVSIADIDKVRKNFSKVINGASVHTEIRIIRKDGQEIEVKITAVPIKVKGEIVGVIGVAEDITKRKQEQAALLEAKREVELSNSLKEAVINSASRVSIIATDVNGIITVFNKGAEQLLGYSAEEMIGKQTPLIIHLEEEIKTRTQKLLDRSPDKLSWVDVFLYGTESGMIDEQDWTYVRKDGSRLAMNLVVTPMKDSNGEVIGYVGIAHDMSERKKAEEKLREANQLYQRLSTLDGLTEIANRRRFDEVLANEWERCGQQSKPISLIMLDIDHFKSFNDTYGHQGGDICLKKVAKTIEELMEKSWDLVARYGGEEFAIILPDTGADAAAQIAEKIRRRIEELAIPHAGSKVSDVVTVSVGVSSVVPDRNVELRKIIEQADSALYQAKHQGRNRVIVY